MKVAEPPAFIEVPEEPLPTPPFVKEGEAVVWLGRPALRSVASSVAGFLVLALFMLVFGAFGVRQVLTNGGPGALLLLVPLVLLLVVVFPLMNLQRMRFVITDQGAYTRRGVIGERVNQTTFDKITDISYTQDIWGRFLGYGTLNVNTAGSATNALVMVGLPNALDVKRLLENAKDQGLGRRGRRPPEASDTVPVFLARSRVAQVQCANCAKRFKRPRSELGKPGPCPICGQPTPYKEVRPPGRTRSD